MAKNWSVSEAVKAIQDGVSVEDIQDISKRFPLLAHNAAKGETGLATIIASLSEKVGALTIERKLKEVYGDTSPDTEEVEEAVEEVAEEKPAPKTKGKTKKEEAVEEKPATKGKGKKKPEPVEVDEDEFEDFDDEEEEEEVKPAKKAAAAKGKKKPDPEPVEEDEEDWDDDEEEDEDTDDGLEELSPSELKKLAKDNKVSIAGLKSAKDIIAKLRAKGITAPEADEDDEDDDEWDI